MQAKKPYAECQAGRRADAAGDARRSCCLRRVSRVYSRSPKVGDPIAPIPKSNVIRNPSTICP